MDNENKDVEFEELVNNIINGQPLDPECKEILSRHRWDLYETNDEEKES